jgi:type IV pilus assembly protein PilA
MNHKSRTSQGGFSLVELMVVVAIIGVLASIAVPAVNKYIAKARQSEAKTSLSSLYTSEKAFYAEYTAYHSAFQAVGYSPEGKMRYNVGFSAAGGDATAQNGFNPATVTNAATNANAYCVAAGVAMTASRTCAVLFGATGAAPPAIVGYAVNSAAGTFLAGAAAVIHAGVAAGDVWSIDHNKDLTNVTNGIP